MENMNINRDALEKFGLNGRVAKQREEALELALACDRYLTWKGDLFEVVAEACDVTVVTDSIRLVDTDLWQQRMTRSYDKLEEAVYGSVTEF